MQVPATSGNNWKYTPPHSRVPAVRGLFVGGKTCRILCGWQLHQTVSQILRFWTKNIKMKFICWQTERSVLIIEQGNFRNWISIWQNTRKGVTQSYRACKMAASCRIRCSGSFCWPIQEDVYLFECWFLLSLCAVQNELGSTFLYRRDQLCKQPYGFC